MNSNPKKDLFGFRRTVGKMQIFTGLPVLRGFVSGPVCVFRSVQHDEVEKTLIKPEEVEREEARLEQAFSQTRRQIALLASNLEKQISKTALLVFDGHLMMLDDPTFLASCKELVVRERFTAERAVVVVAERYEAIFSRMNDVYLKERTADVQDVCRRLVHTLQGRIDQVLAALDRPSIIIADELLPAGLIALPRDKVLGIATDRGSTTSHVALLTRALGIPSVAGLGHLSECVQSGTLALMDGTRGKVFINPDAEARAAFDKMISRSKVLEESIAAYRSMPGQLRDGRRIPVMANADCATDPEALRAAGTEGVGLFRTEYLWLSKEREPNEDEQAAVYSGLADRAPAGVTITIRAFDLGGDKLAPGMSLNMHREENPFLGNRSIRYLLQAPAMFRTHLRAILRASRRGNIRLMYPMIATLEELRDANTLLHSCMEELRKENIPFDEKLSVGTMIEIPAAALIADDLAKEAAFFSIGTNDLVQYTMAADRLNSSVARLYQPTHPGVLRLIDLTVKAGHACHRPVAVCGEMASDPVLAVLLVGFGVDELSMAVSQIPLIRRILHQVSSEEAAALAQGVREMRGATAEEIYQHCWNTVLHIVPDLLFY